MAMGVTEKLAAHAFDVRYEDMPQEVIEKAKDCLLD
jgi:2-methylcitrate dehydratase PrpD